MKILAGWTQVVAVGLVTMSLLPGIARSQQTGRPQPPGMGGQTGLGQQPDPGGMQPMPSPKDPFGQNQNGRARQDESPLGNSEEKLAVLRNDDRQKKLVADSDRLLQLVTQLHDDVSKTDQHILSVDVVRRAEEIEKLARSVKDRMKGTP